MKHEECKVCGKSIGKSNIGYCEECWNERRKDKYKYVVAIDPPNDESDFAIVNYNKKYGNQHSSGGGVKSKKQLIKWFKGMKESWESYDRIAEREGHKVKPKNLYFYSFTDEITKMELFGMNKLQSFI